MRTGNPTNGATTGPHLHFGVNAFSYNPLVPVLDQEKMKEYMLAIQDYLRKSYFPMSVTLQFQGKGR